MTRVVIELIAEALVIGFSCLGLFYALIIVFSPY